MSAARLPANARKVEDARNAGHYVGDVFVCVGWPSKALRSLSTPPRYSEKYPSVLDALHVVNIINPQIDYRWSFVVGLSVILWSESAAQTTILETHAPAILAATPERLILWQVHQHEFEVIASALPMGIAA